jgi:hypothetical protein
MLNVENYRIFWQTLQLPSSLYSILTFDVAHFRKPKLCIELQLQKPKDNSYITTLVQKLSVKCLRTDIGPFSSALCKCPFLQVCLCPVGLMLNRDKRICSAPIHCPGDTFKCKTDNFCIPIMLRYVMNGWISKARIYYIPLLISNSVIISYFKLIKQ